jgi:hypothetical protein
VHHGTLTAGPFGSAGDAPIGVSRLLDAPQPRRHLADRREHDLVLVISDALYRDVVRTGFCPLDPDRFRAFRVLTKGVTYRGHIYQGPVAAPKAAPKPAPDRPAASLVASGTGVPRPRPGGGPPRPGPSPLPPAALRDARCTWR